MRRAAMLAAAIGVIAALPASSAFAVNSVQLYQASATPNKGGVESQARRRHAEGPPVFRRHQR